MIEVRQFKLALLSSRENVGKYAIMNADTFYNCVHYRKSKVNAPNKLEGLLKITNPCTKRSIYRKYFFHKDVDKNTVLLSLTSRSELGFHDKLSKETKLYVCVKETNWFSYYWHNSDSFIRCPFKLAIAALVCSFISIIPVLYHMIRFFCQFMLLKSIH